MAAQNQRGRDAGFSIGGGDMRCGFSAFGMGFVAALEGFSGAAVRVGTSAAFFACSTAFGA